MSMQRAQGLEDELRLDIKVVAKYAGTARINLERVYFQEETTRQRRAGTSLDFADSNPRR